MIKFFIQFHRYIIGILISPIFAFIIYSYFAKKLINKIKIMKNPHNIIKEQKKEMNIIMYDIKNDINCLKKEINISQEALESDKIDQIEKEITMFYEKMQNYQKETEQNKEIKKSEPVVQQPVIQQPTPIHKDQIRIMNENISKFLIVYKEKDKTIDDKNRAIDEKNKSIHILQQKLNETEQRLKKLMTERQNSENKDAIIEEKIKTITMLQQRLQEIENKFRNIALLHKSITEKEEIKNNIIEEKNKFIDNLQYKLNKIEEKLQNIIIINENNKEEILNKRLFDINEKIQGKKNKNLIFIILSILFLLIGI
jgi:chromosome segregation ATPase